MQQNFSVDGVLFHPLVEVKTRRATQGIPIHTTKNNNEAWYSNRGPVEMMMSLNSMDYIDVSVPFQTQYDFLLTLDNRKETAGFVSKGLATTHGKILVSDSSAINARKLAIFQAVGDDFVYGLFRPPLKVLKFI